MGDDPWSDENSFVSTQRTTKRKRSEEKVADEEEEKVPKAGTSIPLVPNTSNMYVFLLSSHVLLLFTVKFIIIIMLQ